MSRLDELFEGLPRHLTVEELASVLGVGKQTAYNWLSRGLVPGYKVAGTWVIVRDEVRDHLVAHRNRPPGSDQGAGDGPPAP